MAELSVRDQAKALRIPPHEVLPFELVSRILLLSRSYTNYGRRAQARVDVLCTVCKEWRFIIESSPSFYTSYILQIQNDKGIDQKLDDIVLRAHTWLSRSGALPVDLWIHIPHRLLSSRLPSLLQPTLALVSPRIRFLSFKCDRQEIWKILDVLPALPALQELSISGAVQGSSGGTVTELAGLRLSFRGAPNLTTVSLVAFYEHHLSIPQFLPWSQLTSLSIEDRGIQYPVVMGIVFASINLVDLSLTSLYDWPAQVQTFATTFQGVHRSLKTLKIINCAPPYLNTINFLCLPALQEFEMKGWSRTENNSVAQALWGLYQRSHFSLTSLYITTTVLDRRVLLQFLERNPSITELIIHQCGCLRDEFVSSLIVPDNPSPSSSGTTTILPQLASFIMSDILKQGIVEDSTIVRLVESRLEAQTPLKDVHITSRKKFGVATEVLEGWKIRGCVVELVTPKHFF